MASPSPTPRCTGVVALESARRILSVIIADHATDINYSADALARLAILLSRSTWSAPFDDSAATHTSKVAEYFLNWYKHDLSTRGHVLALYYSIADDLNRLCDQYEIYRTILQKKGQVSVNHENVCQKLLKVQKNTDRLLEVLMEDDEQGVGGERGGDFHTYW